MDLQFRHLRQLRVVSETGSLNKAATVLGLPQPALSRQIRRLEELFGGTLFERDQHGTRPTPPGQHRPGPRGVHPPLLRRLR
ncbi:helix-turn-helix domain-containing protein [Streptomyces sudanensis]|uniref:helix-turn-helix domain-containing protein n=1 Tax=Streptomyces sudanensis TaxID=436397 RepID=UPI0020CEE9B1|nr:LysR family transcriptional regulator [Streptomyces sudanensis]MCQ0000964.1 LysR family transcriptional regulator [Streptomyces sudanensis]